MKKFILIGLSILLIGTLVCCKAPSDSSVALTTTQTITNSPTSEPTTSPTLLPALVPTNSPSPEPTTEPTSTPTPTPVPTDKPTAKPTVNPTVKPSATPTPVIYICPDCGKPDGDGTNGTCVQWLLKDVNCPNCGVHVPVRTCHTCS